MRTEIKILSFIFSPYVILSAKIQNCDILDYWYLLFGYFFILIINNIVFDFKLFLRIELKTS